MPLKNKIKFTTILFPVSLILNLLFIGLIITTMLSDTDSLAIFNIDKDYLTAAAVASVPVSGDIIFELVHITMKEHETATLQFSVKTGRNQSNLLINTLYDHNLVAVKPTGYGIIIRALNEGETMLQTLSNDGIVNIAHITVIK